MLPVPGTHGTRSNDSSDLVHKLYVNGVTLREQTLSLRILPVL